MFSVETKNLTVKFGDFAAVGGVSFAVEPGEIFGFLGANGAGKTTTIRVLCGLLTPTGGEVRVMGLDVRRKAEAVKKRVGYMSQRFTLYYDLTVEENLSFAASLRKLQRGYYEKRKEELLKFIGFQFPMKTLVGDLPGGLKQEVSLAAAMLHDPDVIFLDEPTAGVTPAARIRFWNLIKGLASRDKTVFVTTHYMDEAEQCGRVALMGSGKIFALDNPERLKRAAFPEPLYEVEPLPKAPAGWWKALAQGKAAKDLKPFGLRYHVLQGEEFEWKRAIRSLEGKAVVKRIKPSLEDVFVRVLERGNP